MPLITFFEDNLVEASDTLLDAHTADSGQGWIHITNNFYGTGAEREATVRGGTGYLSCDDNGGDAIYFVDEQPPFVDFNLEAQINNPDVFSPSACAMRFWVRAGDDGSGAFCGTGYEIELLNKSSASGAGAVPRLRVLKKVHSDGSPTTLAEVSLYNIYTSGVTHTIRILVSGSTITIYFNGVQRLSVTDSSYNGSGGFNRVGFMGRVVNGTTDLKLLYFKVTGLLNTVNISDTLSASETISNEIDTVCLGTVSGKDLYDNFDGPSGRKLKDHTTDSGHTWQISEGFWRIRESFFGSDYNSPFILSGAGRINTPLESSYLQDSQELIYTPRTRNYIVAGCFINKATPSGTNSSLILTWRDTTEIYERRGRQLGIRGKRYELWLDATKGARLYRRIYNTLTLLDSEINTFDYDTPNAIEIKNIGSNIAVTINNVEIFNVNDLQITEIGKVTINVYGQSRSGGYPLGFWMMNYLYIDDSFATVGTPNKSLVFSDGLKAKESFILEKPIFDIGFFKNIVEGFQFADGLAITMDQTEKSISFLEKLNSVELLSILKDTGCWYNADWDFRKKLTIDKTKVPNTNQTDFPMLVLLASDAGLQANAQADGDDILFTDSTGLVKLKHELVFYDTATGKLEAWVKIPTLSASVDTVIFMYYGNAVATAQEDPTNVWDSHYRAVYHLEGAYNATPGEVLDSTGNNFDGEASASDVPAQVDGKVGKGQDFEESTREELLFDAMATMMGTGGKTIGPTPTFVAKGTASASSGTSLTPTYPAGMQSGDLLILVISSSDPAGGSANSITALSAPWAQKHALEGSDTDGQLEIWYRYVPEAGLTGTLAITIATPDTNAVMQAQFYAYRGCHQTSPFEGGALTNGNGTTVTMPAITTTDVNRLAVAFGVNGADNAIANPTGETGGDWVESTGGEDRTTTGNDVTQDAFQAPIASAGTITGGTYAITSSGWAVRGFALVPRNFYELTMEVWFKQEDTTTPANQRRVILLPGVTATAINIGSRSTGNFVASVHDGQQFLTINTIETISTLGTTFHYLALKRASGDTVARLDKTTKFTDTEILSDFHASSVMQLSQDSANLAWDGILDEFRISDVARSDDWLDACYNNQNSPGTFYALGSIETIENCTFFLVAVLDQLAGLETISQPARTLPFTEIGHFNDPFGVGGNSIEKSLIIADFFGAIETVNPNLEFTFGESLTVADTVGRVFEFIETFATAELTSIDNVFELIDSASMTDIVALAIYKQLLDGALLTDAFALIRMLPETFTLGDAVALFKSSQAQEGAGFSENISIVRSGITETTDPDRIHSVRRSTYFVL